jgi:hypothetical protein
MTATKTATFLADNNIDVEQIIYSVSKREIIVSETCILEHVSANDFLEGVSARQHQLSANFNIRIV